MRTLDKRPLAIYGAVLVTLGFNLAALADEADDEGRLAEITVTAQKREQSIQDVGLTIQAASGVELQNRGIEGMEDLPKLVPGLSYTKSIFSTPVYTLRGVGLYDATWGASPAVAVYTDQVPRNFPVMSDGLDLDIQRVEVLKGPQGTLFGQSSTGGAVNYILNKPTADFQSGVDASIERFDRTTFEAYISGPLSDTVRVRFAARAVEGGAWQYTPSLPNSEYGSSDKVTGRLTLDWTPTDQLSTEGVLTLSRDHSEYQAPQFAGSLLNTYSATALAAANANPGTRNPYGVVNNAAYAALTTPGSPGYNASFLGQQSAVVGLLNNTNPAATANPATNAPYQAGAQAQLGAVDYYGNARAAGYSAGLLGPSDNNYFQASLRGDYKIQDDLTFTSVTAVAHQNLGYGQDLDATAAHEGDVTLWGTVRTLNQEFHLSGNPGKLNWIVGIDYDNSRTQQDNYYDLRDYASNAYGAIPCTVGALVGAKAPCSAGAYGGPYAYINITENDFSSTSRSYAGFANADFKFTDNLSGHAGVRYTKNRQDATYCYNDPAIDQNLGTDFIFSALEEAKPFSVPLTAGSCFPIGDGTQGTTKGEPTGKPLTTPPLVESNTSFRVGLDYKLDQGTLLYVNVSQGFKAGIFSEIGASATSEYLPAKQEKLVDYEAGFKAPFFDHRLNIDGAIFDYQYTNKQVRARVEDPVYGLLEKLINVPKSRVLGAEADIEAIPVRGLHLSLAATYLQSKVTSYFSEQYGTPVYNAQGYTGNFQDSKLPFTPQLSGSFDTEYDWNFGSKYTPIIGATVFHQGTQNATFSNAVLQASDFNLQGYTTLDLRAGVRSGDNKWAVTAYVNNVTNKYYVTSTSFYLDAFERFTGMPTVYGVRLHYNF